MLAPSENLYSQIFHNWVSEKPYEKRTQEVILVMISHNFYRLERTARER